ncbi:ABC transporter substrate-binding protein [Vogesella sp. LIG4]|uniref:substrate-binding periplasmic protein n=1 Tax=Vogesella sp. LIG4 TaxID=1192162 RepID=UPI0008200EED|nr:transporter substrate-binding domain-containing protein [Vogesella sp. LIG4]SCK22023.1 amino acid ABC transporter substrate-binding protein, PAAT family [Vogesella sp. LIG4]
MIDRVLALLLCLATSIAQAKTIVIAAEDDWPPYSYGRTGSNAPQGLTPLLVREAFASQDINTRFVTVPFSQCLKMAETGSVVGCFDVSITADNRSKYIWHRTPLFYEEAAIFGLVTDQSSTVTQATLHGHTVGLTQGYTYPSSFTADSDIRKITAAKDEQLIDMLLAHQVDYILMNTLPGLMQLNKNPPARDKVGRLGVVGVDAFWLAFSRRNPDGASMARKFEAGLQTLHKNGRYQRILNDFRQQLGVD